MHVCVVDLTYTAELSVVEEHLPAHREFLAAQYAAGTFLASGRKEPRTGGIILAVGTCEEVRALTAQDPLRRAGVADYRVTEFVPTMTADALSGVREG